MTKYTLQYFTINGRGGGIRLLMDYLKVPFTDEYIDRENWLKVKETTPFGQIPVLKFENGFELPETVAIYRYIGAKHGAIAETLEECAICDAIADHVQDFMTKMVTFVFSIFFKAPRERILENQQEAKKYFFECHNKTDVKTVENIFSIYSSWFFFSLNSVANRTACFEGTPEFVKNA
uniref:GST N-terminal domain-containing protein n=1 Tax=Panagrolaimus sp. JU765 TaxID=591449 RepID=A0AC34PYF0_9BILA